MKNTKLYYLFKKIIDFDRRYNLTVVSASLSFYALVSVISLFIIFVQIINYRYDIMDNLLINKLLSIFSDSFSNHLKEFIPEFRLTNYTSLSVLSLFWSASCTVHSYNKIADNIYKEFEKRSSIKLRISSLLMFLMLFVIVMFEIIFVLFSTSLIEKYFFISNKYLAILIEIILDVFSIFLILLILYTYVPPVKMSFKKSYYGALVVAIVLYAFLNIYILVIHLYEKIAMSVTIIFVLNSILIFIFSINYIIIVGIIINYNRNNIGKKK